MAWSRVYRSLRGACRYLPLVKLNFDSSALGWALWEAQLTEFLESLAVVTVGLNTAIWKSVLNSNCMFLKIIFQWHLIHFRCDVFYIAVLFTVMTSYQQVFFAEVSVWLVHECWCFYQSLLFKKKKSIVFLIDKSVQLLFITLDTFKVVFINCTLIFTRNGVKVTNTITSAMLNSLKMLPCYHCR